MGLLTGTIDLRHQYTDACAHWAHRPFGDAWACLRNSRNNSGANAFDVPGYRYYQRKNDYLPTWAKLRPDIWMGFFMGIARRDARLIWRVSWVGLGFPVRVQAFLLPLLRQDTRGPCRAGECGLIASAMAILRWKNRGTRNIAVSTDIQNGIIWVAMAKSRAPSETVRSVI